MVQRLFDAANISGYLSNWQLPMKKEDEYMNRKMQLLIQRHVHTSLSKGIRHLTQNIFAVRLNNPHCSLVWHRPRNTVAKNNLSCSQTRTSKYKYLLRLMNTYLFLLSHPSPLPNFQTQLSPLLAATNYRTHTHPKHDKTS